MQWIPLSELTYPARQVKRYLCIVRASLIGPWCKPPHMLLENLNQIPVPLSKTSNEKTFNSTRPRLAKVTGTMPRAAHVIHLPVKDSKRTIIKIVPNVTDRWSHLLQGARVLSCPPAYSCCDSVNRKLAISMDTAAEYPYRLMLLLSCT